MILLLILGAGLLYLLIYIAHKVWETKKAREALRDAHYFNVMHGNHDE